MNSNQLRGTCLISGGSGFLGSYLTKEMLRRYEAVSVKAVSRSEKEMAELIASCSGNKRLIPIIGDIRDTDILRYVLRGVNTVIHLAAMKHIDLCDANPTEAVNTNVVATMNLLSLFTGDTFIGMSTDKVAGATGCYGATKLLLERLVLEKAQRCPFHRYMIVRSGNIFGSTGSVIPKWIQQIKQDNKITVTDLGMTRFFIDPESLVDFMLDVAMLGQNNKIYIPELIAVSLSDLAKAVVEIYGNADTKVAIIGRREGEKMHERLFFFGEKNIVTGMKTETSDGGENSGRVDRLKAWLEKYL